MTYETIITAATVIGIPALRNLVGWLNAAMEDGVITVWEWGQAAQTVVRVLILQALIYFSVPLFGVTPDLIATGTAAALIDWLYTLYKKVHK